MTTTLKLFPLKMLAWLPLCLLYLLSDVVAFFLCYIFRYRRSVVLDNLRRSFPDYTDSRRKQIARRFYRHLSDVIFETVKLLHISDTELLRRIEVLNADLIDKAAAQGQSTLLYLGHYGNWEWVQAIGFHCQLPTLKGEVYRPAHDRSFDEVLFAMRNRFAPNQLIPQARIGHTLLRLHSEQKTFCVGLISDQRPHIETQANMTQFLNQRTGFITGGEQIGKRIGVQFIYVDIEKTKRGHYRLTLQPIEPGEVQTDFPISETFMNMLERSILRQPELWLWSHKRWSHLLNNPNL